jgi:hypothetical protein
LQLERAFTTLSGIQQPPSCHESEEACRQYEIDVEDGEFEIDMIAKEIFVALTGKKPCFKEDPEKPEPPPNSEVRDGDVPDKSDRPFVAVSIIAGLIVAFWVFLLVA